ncbi:MAG: protein kinase domain-containing protein, partial [Planctomycetota bacterium]
MGHGQPSTIGPYTIVEELGRGGMGVVYRARRADIGREVALKLIRPQDDADPDSIARFQREARAAAGLAGTPGIVGVLDAGEDDGRLYIAMDFIAGRSLESLIDDADLAPARAAELVKQAAEAVHAAHQHGTLHRDLKPANILVDERDRAWVTDFGLALTREADEASARLTKSGWLVGTPSYMPPEQARAEGLDGRADVYALGATLYECLVGQTPHAGTSMYEVLEQVLREEPPPPSRRNPEVPRDLETIVLKALEKDREQRYPTAQALADDLGRWLAGEAIVASPPGPLERLRRGVRRRKALTAAVVATVATGIVVAAITIPGWIAEQRARAKEQADAAAALREAERRKQAELTALAELSGLWAKLVLAKEGFHNAARDPAKVRASIAALRDEVSRFIETHPGAPQGPYVRARAHLYLDALPEAEADLRASIALAPEFAPGHALLAQVLIRKYRRALYAVGSARSVLAHRRAVQPIMEEAKAELQAAADVPGGRAGVAAWRLLRTREDDIGEVVARALSRHYLEGDRQGAIDLLQEAHRADQAAAYAGWIGSWAIDPELAEKWATEALRLRPHWGRVHLDRGTARMKRRNVAGAIEDFTRALELGGVDEMALSNRAVAHYQAGRLREAIDDATRAIAIDDRALAKADLGDTKGALEDYGEAIALAKDDAEVWYHRGVTLARYGDRLRAAGRRAEWAEAYRRARADYDQAIALEP